LKGQFNLFYSTTGSGDDWNDIARINGLEYTHKLLRNNVEVLNFNLAVRLRMK
jgi:hypothetical protein